jgi:hypothetical protein
MDEFATRIATYDSLVLMKRPGNACPSPDNIVATAALVKQPDPRTTDADPDRQPGNGPIPNQTRDSDQTEALHSRGIKHRLTL